MTFRLSLDEREDVVLFLNAVAEADCWLKHTEAFDKACRVFGVRMDFRGGPHLIYMDDKRVRG